jgi:NAD-dependent deacetylase
VWRFYSQRRAAAATCEPNAGHRALVALEARLGDRFLLATQNVDGLHPRAGSRRVVELHGNLFRSRCARCDRAPFDDAEVYADNHVPSCAACAARGEFGLLRPDIVWFGEALDPRDLERVEQFMNAARRHTFVFVAAGTSGNVYPAAGLVDHARRAGARTWLVNLEPAENAARFDHFVRGASGEALPALFA